MRITRITDDVEKGTITRYILEALPEWFEMPEGREAYIRESAGKYYFCAYDKEQPIGFVYLKQTGQDTLELAVMGVLKKYHRMGIGKSLFETAKSVATKEGFSFMQVKTVQMGMYEDYDKTNMFYKALGFKEFEVFPTLWDKANPCQIYVMALK